MSAIINNNREQEHIVLDMKDAGCSEDTIHRFLPGNFLIYGGGTVEKK